MCNPPAAARPRPPLRDAAGFPPLAEAIPIRSKPDALEAAPVACFDLTGFFAGDGGKSAERAALRIFCLRRRAEASSLIKTQTLD